MNAQNDQFRVENLYLSFSTRRGTVQAVEDVTFTMNRGQTMVLVGESGCGKTSLGRAILRLLPRNVQKYRGKVFLNSQDIMQLSREKFRREIRWKKIAMVPQAAMNSLNPVIKVSEQVIEPLIKRGTGRERRKAMEKAREVFQLVGVPQDFLERYPFELSGGMRQRVILAMALITNPDLVILDEPTSALDLLTQANIMNVLKRIKQEQGFTFILITHDIATSSELADLAGIMYAGQLVEFSRAYNLFREPFHPYSRKLMASVPSLQEKKELEYLPGQPPSLLEPPQTCRFLDRCPDSFERCEQEPPVIEVKEGHQVKCWLYK